MTLFAGRTGRGVRVAVIDSGVNPENPHVNGVAGGVSISENAVAFDFTDRLGHGTAVAAVVREIAPDAAIFAVKIFDRALAARIEILVRGIDWAAENGMRVVNLSLGTARLEHEEALRAAVERAAARNVVLVAAREDSGARWLPGGLEGMPAVVPVMLDWDCPRGEYRVRDGVFFASGYPRPIPGVPRDKNLKGISFAVAHISGFVARAIEEFPEATGEALNTEILPRASA